MIIYGMPHGFITMFGFILMLGITMVAAPGVPGGAVMAALGLLGSMLGFNEELLSLMIALYLTQDSFGTACNVTGDGAIAILVNKFAGNKLEVKKLVFVFQDHKRYPPSWSMSGYLFYFISKNIVKIYQNICYNERKRKRGKTMKNLQWEFYYV